MKYLTLSKTRLRLKKPKKYEVLPKLNCGKCGFDCEGMAELIAAGKKDFSDCVVMPKSGFKSGVRIVVDGKEIQLGRFAREIISNTITGLISSLKGAENPKEIRIDLENNRGISKE